MRATEDHPGPLWLDHPTMLEWMNTALLESVQKYARTGRPDLALKMFGRMSDSEQKEKAAQFVGLGADDNTLARMAWDAVKSGDFETARVYLWRIRDPARKKKALQILEEKENGACNETEAISPSED